MQKYVIFIKDGKSKVMPRELVTSAVTNQMKQNGFRKHHVVVEAENEKEAIRKLNEFSEGYLDSLKEFSGNAMICAIAVIIIALLYLFRS